MTLTSVAPANPKTAEFARLFDLFDRVATRRARALTGDTSQVISEDDIANVPAEFAPVFKNLSTILSLRARRNEEHARRTQPAPTTQSRHPSFAIHNHNHKPMPHTSDAIERDVEIPCFPLGERYPFTFKLMLHKLYDLDEWADKVKCAVETSKSQFKPLGERDTNIVGDAAQRSRVYPALGVSAKFKPPTRHACSAVLSTRDATPGTKERGERRSSARPALGASTKFKPLPSAPRHHPAHTTSIPSSGPEARRVVKKRCVGRRKSINGPMSTGVWVYDAAIAAIEVAGARPAVEITLSAPDGWVETRARHRSLPASKETQTRSTARRRVKITVSLPQKEPAVSPQPLSVLSVEQVIESGTSVKKKRSVASVFATEPCKRAAIKRPLCV